ncbi:iron chelate uptake ABC transporter family permease subunit, partial [Bacteroides fragilis]|nr:iron chelate uptake ABC transporter family permease subunit [Bacteroides fragilis]
GHIGINVQRLRIAAIVASAVLTAGAVSFAGLIGFVGLDRAAPVRSVRGFPLG